MLRFWTVLALALPLSAAADDYALGDLTIGHPKSRPTAATAMAGAGYMTIANTGAAPDRLVAAEADFPRVELHDIVMDGDVAKMQQMMGVELPAGETVTFAPGGMHVMFMGLNGDPFEIGEEIPVTLVFEKAGRIDVVFTVADMDAAATDHSGH